MALFFAPSFPSKFGFNKGLIFVTKIETHIFWMSLAVDPKYFRGGLLKWELLTARLFILFFFLFIFHNDSSIKIAEKRVLIKC